MSEDRPPLHVLLVEDDAGDVLMIREALAENEVAEALDVVGDGTEALRYLRGEGPHAGRRRPDLVLLDLNLPGMTGLEVLSAIKADPDLRRIPVVVLTTSDAERDVVGSYDRHANAFIRKPTGFDQFVGVTRQIDRFYGEVVQLPPT